VKNQEIIHVYFVPGLAAGKEIFKNIQLPENQYKTHILEWLIPEKGEAISHYASRMAGLIKEQNPVLIGVSFGGVIVQEMSKYLQLEKLIIISSIKSKHELPLRLRLMRKTKAYKLAPTKSLAKIQDFTKYAIGPKTKRKLQLYQEYLSVKDSQYLDWAIENMVCWDREEPDENVIHIHEDKEPVFPAAYIKNGIQIKGATHVLILSKAKWLNENLPQIIENNTLPNTR